MNSFLYYVDKSLLNYQKKLFKLEKKYLKNCMPLIILDKYDLVKKKIMTYKLTTNILYNNPEFYLDVKEIQLDYTRNLNELAYLEIIWITQHYDYIEEIKSTYDDILQLIKFGKKYQFITYIQYKYIKKMLPKINKIFDYDKSMENFYLPTKNIMLYLTSEEIELFYNILDIIINMIDIISIKSNIYDNLSNMVKMSSNIKYGNLIKKIKTKLEKYNS